MNEDTIEMLDKCEESMIEQLKRTQYGTSEAKALIDDVCNISKTKVAELQTEQTRLNNNERNDLDRKKLELEEMKLKVEEKKIRAGYVDNLWQGGVFLFGTYIAWNGEMRDYCMKGIDGVMKFVVKMFKRH